jgi:hypothetical protein
MSPPVQSGPSIVAVDAEEVFRHPLAVVLLVTFVVGALDAVGYQQFGVFTANQAGNLVIVWTLLSSTPASAGLALASLLGCALGITAVVLVRRAWRWLVTPAGSRLMLVVAAVLIVGAQRIGRSLSTSTSTAATAVPDVWSSGWWSECAAIALIALSIAVLGMVFISGGGIRAPILASTNAYVDAIRYGVAGLAVGEERSEWWRRARRAVGFPVCWTVGAAAAALLPVGPLGVTVGAAVLVVVVVVAVLARRVSAADPAARPTV